MYCHAAFHTRFVAAPSIQLISVFLASFQTIKSNKSISAHHPPSRRLLVFSRSLLLVLSREFLYINLYLPVSFCVIKCVHSPLLLRRHLRPLIWSRLPRAVYVVLQVVAFSHSSTIFSDLHLPSFFLARKLVSAASNCIEMESYAILIS